jgi:DNA repair exonuclease SbcCD ATPase subunit
MSETNKQKLLEEVKAMARNALLETDSQSKLERAALAVEKAEKTIEELLSDVAERDTELAAVTAQAKELTDKVQTLEVKARELEEALAEARKSLDEQKVRAEKAEEALSLIEQERRLHGRVLELEAAKVLKSGDKLEAQRNRVKVMSDEEFASYRDELVDLRSELEAALRESASNVETVADLASDDVVDVLPPEVKKEAAHVMIPNPELSNHDDAQSRIKEFGKAIAELLQNTNK